MNLLKSNMVVKPVSANDDSSGWLTVQETPLMAFWDEIRRYGWRVACHNLWWYVRN